MMTYTTCEICGNKQYCFLQFRSEMQENNGIMIKKAACLHCLSVVYDTNKNRKQMEFSSASRGKIFIYNPLNNDDWA